MYKLKLEIGNRREKGEQNYNNFPKVHKTKLSIDRNDMEVNDSILRILHSVFFFFVLVFVCPFVFGEKCVDHFFHWKVGYQLILCEFDTSHRIEMAHTL